MARRTRQEKYPDTETFHYYNCNPKNKIASDCVVRAIATATGISWEDTLQALTDLSKKTKESEAVHTIEKYKQKAMLYI